MRRLALAVTLGGVVAGCVRDVPAAELRQAEEGKCALVHTLLREPVPARLLAHWGVGDGPAPVLVYVRRPREGALLRFFEGSPRCEGERFRVVQDSVVEAVVLYLEPQGEGSSEGSTEGYTYDAQRAGPKELTMAGTPQGRVRREGDGWVTLSP